MIYMKKLYAGLLAIILCGTISVALVAGEIEETIISGDANGLRGLVAGIIYSKKNPNRKKLKDFLLDLDFDSANKELKDQLISTLFVPGLLINVNYELREKLCNGLWIKAYEVYGPEKNDILYDYIIRGLKNLKKGGSYLQEISETIKSKKELPTSWCFHSSLSSFLGSPSEYSNERLLKEKMKGAWDLLEKVLMMSVHVVSRSPKGLLEALEYTEKFEEFLDEDLKMLLPLIGAIFGAEKYEFSGHPNSKKISGEMARFLQGIELVERKENSKKISDDMTKFLQLTEAELKSNVDIQEDQVVGGGLEGDVVVCVDAELKSNVEAVENLIVQEDQVVGGGLEGDVVVCVDAELKSNVEVSGKLSIQEDQVVGGDIELKDLVEKKEKSFFDKIVNRKTIAAAVLGLGIFLCYRFKLWRVLNSNFFNFGAKS